MKFASNFSAKFRAKNRENKERNSRISLALLFHNTVPLEHNEKRTNKQVTVIKPTLAAYMVNLKGKVLTLMDKCEK